MTDPGGETLSGDHYRRFLQTALQTALIGPDSEPLPDPKEQALVEFAEFLDSGTAAERLMRLLDRAGLTVCWKAPTDE